MKVALLLTLSAAIAAPLRPDFRVTRTVTGVRLRIAGISSQQVTLFVAGGPGLRVFQHERLDPQRDGSFAIDLGLTDSGLYMAFAEFVTQDGSPQMEQQAFTIGTALAPRAAEPADEAHESNGLSATIDLSRAKAGRESVVAFDLSEAVAGAEPELFIVSPDLTEARHVTADSPARGAHVAFTPIFPRAGRYKVWLIVPRSGSAATIPFVIDVS